MIVSILGDSKLAIHHPCEIHVYSATKEQLQLLSKGDNSEWKSFYPPAFSVAGTCLLNSVISLGDPEGNVFRWNSVIAAVAFLLGVVFFCLAKKAQKETKALLEEILSQPVQASRTNDESNVKGWSP